jgi:predicted esterase
MSGKDLFHGGTAISEIKNLYEKVTNKYQINENKVILVGFSQGATLAMEMALYNDINCYGVIAGCPFNNEIISDHSKDLKDRDTRIYIFSGDKDFGYEGTKTNVDLLKTAGVKVKLKINKDMGHEFSKDIAKDIDEALQLIFGETDN